MNKQRPWYRRFLHGWIVSGSGFTGVTTNATLSGSGTSVSPLGITNWPFAFYTAQTNSAAQTALGAANQVYITGFTTPTSVVFSNITVNIKVADAVNLYDFGVYNQAGSLLAHIGAQSLPSTGLRSFAVTGGAKTIQAGLYAFAFTGNATTAQVAQDSGPAIIWIQNSAITTSVGGVLPASIGALTISPTTFALEFALF